MSSSPPPSPPPSKVGKVKARSIIYIDGFNFYYGVLQNTAHKWLDLETYFFRLRQDDIIQRIHYFTSPVLGPSQWANQETYLSALGTRLLVTVTCGNHKRKTVKCLVRACTYAGGREFTALEEKRTDVQIALQMLEDTYENRAERFILVSGDSDLVPAVNRVKARGKEVVVYIPAPRCDSRRGRGVAKRRQPALLLYRPRPPSRPSSRRGADEAGNIIRKPADW